MDTCEYEQVIVRDTNEVSRWIPFFRQFFVSSSIWISFFTVGLYSGTPTVMIPQLRNEANSTDAVSEEMASWLSSIHGYAAIPWMIILSIWTEICGRKQPFLFVSFCGICSFIVIFFSSTVTTILIGEIIQGTMSANVITICIAVVTEYSSSKYRGIFLTLKSATFTWGIWCANALGTFFHWKRTALLGILTSVYCFITACFWTESPLWLASKGKFEKCAESHRWLMGTDAVSEKELVSLIESQKQYINKSKENKSRNRVLYTILSKNFCKPLSLCLVTLSLFNFSGKLVVAIYAIDIIKKITHDESKAYAGMLILDGFTVLGMYVGCVLSKFIKRRTILLSGAIVGILFLYLMSLYFYLVKINSVVENNYISLSLLSMFSIAICCGPMLMSSSIYGEVIPLRFRSTALFFCGLYNVCLCATCLKVGPYLFKYLNLYGAFLYYGIMSTICTTLLFFYLPETKDKTLQEIEDSMLYKKVEDADKPMLFKTNR